MSKRQKYMATGRWYAREILQRPAGAYSLAQLFDIGKFQTAKQRRLFKHYVSILPADLRGQLATARRRMMGGEWNGKRWHLLHAARAEHFRRVKAAERLETARLCQSVMALNPHNGIIIPSGFIP